MTAPLSLDDLADNSVRFEHYCGEESLSFTAADYAGTPHTVTLSLRLLDKLNDALRYSRSNLVEALAGKEARFASTVELPEAEE